MGKINVTIPIALLLSVLLIWEFVVRFLGIPSYVLPAPTDIALVFAEPHTQMMKHATITLVESLLGFLFGSWVGLGLGTILAESKAMRIALLPYVVGSNAVPVIAIAPLIVMWFGYGLMSRALVSAFLCFFPLCINTYRGLQAADVEYRELFEVYGATRLQYLIKARFPYAMPYLFAGAKLNATYAVIGAVVAEFIGTTSGLGYGMVHAAYNSDAPRLWAYLSVSILMGISFYTLVWAIEVHYNSNYD